MAEISRPWSGVVLGDSGPYSDDQWTDTWSTLLGPVLATQGVFQDQLSVLMLGGMAASPVTIDTGRALVNGIWYESDVSVDVAIPTPAGNPRVDRIVLRADWGFQTVRITRIEGVEGAPPTPPALVQIDGVTWDLPLWQVHITVGGVISFYRDERAYIGQYEPTGNSPTRIYLEETFFLYRNIMLTGDVIGSFLLTLAGNGTLEALSSLPPSGNFRFNAAAAANTIDMMTGNLRPETFNFRTLFLVKNPNSHANVDRVIGWVTGADDLTPLNGVFFRADGAGNWFAVTRAAGVETITDTAQALDDVWREFKIVQTGTDVVVFLIDDVVVATHRTDIPSGSAVELHMNVFDDGAGAAANTNFMQVQLCKVVGDR